MLAAFSLFIVPIAAAAPIQPQEARLETKEQMVEYATKRAQEAKISPTKVLQVIECESQWNTHAVGDHGTSFGLAQIHNPESDWGISQETAEDPRFAIDLLVRNLKAGHGNRWSCY